MALELASLAILIALIVITSCGGVLSDSSAIVVNRTLDGDVVTVGCVTVLICQERRTAFVDVDGKNFTCKNFVDLQSQLNGRNSAIIATVMYTVLMLSIAAKFISMCYYSFPNVVLLLMLFISTQKHHAIATYISCD